MPKKKVKPELLVQEKDIPANHQEVIVKNENDVVVTIFEPLSNYNKASQEFLKKHKLK